MKVKIFSWEIDVHWPRQPPAQVFVRFGFWEPHYNQSLNFATGERERGLSVYPATLNGLIVSLEPDIELSPLVEGRLAFPVTGRVVGTGSDGEPLLKGVRALPYPLAINTGTRIPKDDSEQTLGVRFPRPHKRVG